MSWLSGGVLFAIGAALWVAYLLPSMLRRRQLQAAELEAAELEAALHRLAETGELPEEDLNLRQRILEHKEFDKAERKVERDNLRALHMAETRRKQELKRARVEARTAAKRERAALIRRRMLAAWMLLLSIVTVVGGAVAMVFGVTWMVSGAGVLGGLASVAALRSVVRRLAAIAAPMAATAPAPALSFEPVALPDAAASRGWTPKQLPRPLHLAQGSAAAATIASVDAVDALRRRAREVAAQSVEPALPSLAAARARSAALVASASAPARTFAASSAAQPLSAAEQVAARYANLDSLADVGDSTLNVTDVLQRRRTG